MSGDVAVRTPVIGRPLSGCWSLVRRPPLQAESILYDGACFKSSLPGFQ